MLGPERLPKVARTVGEWVGGRAQRYVAPGEKRHQSRDRADRAGKDPRRARRRSRCGHRSRSRLRHRLAGPGRRRLPRERRHRR
ncbi:MAG: hypothetical protein U5L03_04040 [Burkholderiaceae bacterium]|nr:hypothetical protein [Burkholderiaceae bacterium]